MTVHRKLDDFPHKIKKIEHFWITLKDGCRLAARMWLPADAETRPVPPPGRARYRRAVSARQRVRAAGG